jgi:hypothetical protein
MSILQLLEQVALVVDRLRGKFRPKWTKPHKKTKLRFGNLGQAILSPAFAGTGLAGDKIT